MILCLTPTGVSLCFIVMAENAFWSQFLEISDSSSDDDELMLMCLVDEDEQMYESSQEYPIKRGGSRPGRAPNKDRRRRLYARLLFDDYWGENPLYDEKQFRIRTACLESYSMIFLKESLYMIIILSKSVTLVRCS